MLTCPGSRNKHLQLRIGELQLCGPLLDAHLANWDVGCVLELTLSNVYDISSVSFYPKEQEVLLAPNTKLVVLPVTNTQQLVDPAGTPRTVKVIQLLQTSGQKPLVS